MAKYEGTGQYTNKQGQAVSYEYEYSAYNTIDEAIAELGEAKVISLVNRMCKVDSNNLAREASKRLNGDSNRPVLSEEQKIANREESRKKRQALKAVMQSPEMLAKLKAMGIEL